MPDHPKANSIDLSRLLLAMPKIDDGSPRFHTWERNDKLEDRTLDEVILQDAKSCLQTKHPLNLKYKVKNTFRSIGTQLSGEIAYRYGDEGLPDGTLNMARSAAARARASARSWSRACASRSSARATTTSARA